MTKDMFAERGRSLENEFFYKVDQELKRKFREQQDAEYTRESLAAASGISDNTVLEELRLAGIRAETLAAVSLVPLIQVAWADGNLAEQERCEILSAAKEDGMSEDQPAFQLLGQWLERAPNSRLSAAWNDYISALAQVLSLDAMKVLKQNLWRRACAVAEAEGGILYVGTSQLKKEAYSIR